VLINDRALLKDLPYPAIAALDKLEKIGKEGVIDEMVAKGIPLNQANQYFDLVTSLQPNETISTITQFLASCGFPSSWYEFSPTLARSFSYSTGPIWEVVVPEFSNSSLLGGERFDNLVENVSGQKIPGTGFGLGFDRTLEAAQAAGLTPAFTSKTKVLLLFFPKVWCPNHSNWLLSFAP
jgi:histidyl-tRNA synthetase